MPSLLCENLENIKKRKNNGSLCIQTHQGIIHDHCSQDSIGTVFPEVKEKCIWIYNSSNLWINVDANLFSSVRTKVENIDLEPGSFFKKSFVVYLLTVNRVLFTSRRLVFSTGESPRDGPWALIAMLSEVRNPTQCGWHHSLAAVLDCTAV